MRFILCTQKKASKILSVPAIDQLLEERLNVTMGGNVIFLQAALFH